ncbi:MAG: endolytic transglycosylase MltG, partial [Caldilineales bacterium]|nr:endolytic transglycosylase MltG [Caldilineales bacterium]
LLFEAYVRVNGLANRLEAGTYRLSAAMTPIEIAAALQNAQAPSVPVRVREGWRLEEIADHLSRTGVVDGNAYRSLAANPSREALGFDLSRYTFLQFLPAGASLEGFLYPDTYLLPAEGAIPSDLIQRQFDELEARVMPLYWEAVAQGRTTMELRDVLTLASIVEREAVVDEERPIIAGVFLNRLAQGMRLEADPTVQYALGYQPDTGRWWKSPLAAADLQVDSPYNTYRYGGLPPGPIASPGLASIRAVLEPAQHDYLFFVAMPDSSGRHVFSRTFEEHLEAVQRYRQGR